MEHVLRNGTKVTLRAPKPEDAEQLVNIMKTADRETRFLARNPGEFQTTVEQEREIIENVLRGEGRSWLIAEYEGEVVGQCSVGYVRSNQRYQHRASVAFLIVQKCCGMGIGGKMMEECIQWCKEHGVEQIELDVVKENERALRMYQSFGFEIVGTMSRALRYPDGTYADEYMMVKVL